MIDGLATEPKRMARKKKASGGTEPAYTLDASGNARVEFVAPPEWLARLDAAAAALGLGRSAYIRMACSRQMGADDRERPAEPDDA